MKIYCLSGLKMPKNETNFTFFVKLFLVLLHVDLQKLFIYKIIAMLTQVLFFYALNLYNFFCIYLHAQFRWVATVLADSALNEFGSRKKRVEKRSMLVQGPR